MLRTPFFLILLGCFLWQSADLIAQNDPPTKYLVKVFLDTEDEKEGFRLLDFDLATYRITDHAEVVAGPEELMRLAEMGYTTEIVPDFNSNPEVIEYPSYEEMYEKLEQLAEQNPDIVQFSIVGYSQRLHLPIPMIKISDNVHQEEDEPAILFDAQHHAREPVGMLCTLVLAEYLINNYGSPRVADWIENSEIFIIPCLNVEGWQYLYENNLPSPWWRKNMRENNGNSIFQPSVDGVDLNRNYKFNHSLGGSPEMGSWTYRGPTGFSESETRAKRNLTWAQKFVASITYHSYGEIILFPWNEDPRPGDFELLEEIASDMGRLIPTVDGSGTYAPVRCGCQVGQSQCWMYGEGGTLEVLIETADVFIPNRYSGDAIAWNNLDAALYILDRVQGPGLTGLVTDAATGLALEAIVHVKQLDNGASKPRTCNKDLGRYYRLLQPGTYNIEFRMEGYENKIISDVEVATSGLTELSVALDPSASSIFSSGIPDISITAYPNPFTTQMQFEMAIRKPGEYRMEVFNQVGKRVAVPIDTFLPSGTKLVNWDGRSDQGLELANGVYLVMLTNETDRQFLKVVKQ